jgi:hypothetical protein
VRGRPGSRNDCNFGQTRRALAKVFGAKLDESMRETVLMERKSAKRQRISNTAREIMEIVAPDRRKVRKRTKWTNSKKHDSFANAAH